MEPHEFERALRRGLGRAHQAWDGEIGPELRQILLGACLEDWRRDSQLEDSRAPYLIGLVERTGDPAFYRDRIAERLAEPPDDEGDASQLMEFAQHFAAQGHLPSREAMRRALERWIDRDIADADRVDTAGWLIDPLIELDGVEGLIFVARQFGRRARDRPDDVEDDLVIETGRRVLGARRADRALARARKVDELVAAYLAAADETRGELLQSDKTQGSPYAWMRDLDWPSARARIEAQIRETGHHGFNWSKWGQWADEAELLRAAVDLVAHPNDDAEILRPMLVVFGRRAFPLPPDRLIALLDHGDRRVSWFAANALANVSHLAVRERALRMLDEPRLRSRSIDLLEANWQVGDALLVERLLAEDLDDDDRHHVVMSIEDLAKAHGPELIDALVHAYEATPCTSCRLRVIERLVGLDALPDALARESLFDANLDTRELARTQLGPPAPAEPAPR